MTEMVTAFAGNHPYALLVAVFMLAFFALAVFALFCWFAYEVYFAKPADWENEL